MGDPRPAGNVQRLQTTCALLSWLCPGSEPSWETGLGLRGSKAQAQTSCLYSTRPFWFTPCISGWACATLQLRLFAVCSDSQLCLTLCNPMHCSPPGSSGYGIFQARILGCYFHLQSIFPTQVLKLHLLHWQANSLPLNHQETGLVSSNLASDSFTWTVEVKCISICTVLAQSCFIYAILKCAV